MILSNPDNRKVLTGRALAGNPLLPDLKVDMPVEKGAGNGARQIGVGEPARDNILSYAEGFVEDLAIIRVERCLDLVKINDDSSGRGEPGEDFVVGVRHPEGLKGFHSST